jgi:hypothetical protein
MTNVEAVAGLPDKTKNRIYEERTSCMEKPQSQEGAGYSGSKVLREQIEERTPVQRADGK